MMNNNNLQYKKWFVSTIILILTLLLLVGIVTYIIDPYFHYHKPITKYRLYNERYINDGIARHFDYDTIITGNSLAQNYQASYVDQLFKTKSVKLTYSGAGYKELFTALERNLSYTNLVDTVIASLDFEDLYREANWQRYNEEPAYLYDNNAINDVKYLLNKNVLYRGVLYNILMTLRGEASTTFDEYSSWIRESGPDKACASLKKIEPNDIIMQESINEGERERVIENLESNPLRIIEDHPQVQFIIIIPPSSIAKWAEYYLSGEIGKRIEALELALSMMLEYDNVKIFAFDDAFDITTDLYLYCDSIHYDSSVNNYILDCIRDGKHNINKINYLDYIFRIQSFYSDYDYASLNQYIS